jgi:hypothetical protein
MVGVRFSLVVLFAVVPMLALGVIVGIFYLSRGLIRIGEFHWPQMGLLGFILVANAMLYLMGNAVGIKQQWWKFVVLALMIVAPVWVLATVPYPAASAQMKPVLESSPPQVILCLGLAWMLSGLISLISFVRHHPLPVRDSA